MLLKTRQFRACIWAVDVVLIVLALFFLMRAGRFLFAATETSPEPLASPLRDGMVGGAQQVMPYTRYAAIGNSDLFGTQSSSTAIPKKVVEEDLPETTLDLELLGCVLAGDTEQSFAIIRDRRKRTEDTYIVGDFIVSDARVEEIRKSEVVISRAGRRETLQMAFGEEAQTSAPSPAYSRGLRPPVRRPPVRTSSASDQAIRVVNDKLRYINRVKFSQEVGNSLGSLLNQVRTTPNVVDNKPAGIQIDSLGSDPISGQSGIRPGDIVKSINGNRVNALDDVIGLRQRLQNAPEIRVVVERDGRHTTLVYKVR